MFSTDKISLNHRFQKLFPEISVPSSSEERPQNKPEKVSTDDFNALMRHLDELEAEEEAEDEQLLDSDDDPDNQVIVCFIVFFWFIRFV